MSGPAKHHIPFPAAFLSLNTPAHKSTGDNVTSPSELPVHSFLSNRPAVVPRHSSISSVSSDSTVGSAPSSPPTQAAASPSIEQKVPAFLALNSKYAAPPTSAKEMSSKSSFLSNKH